MKILEITKKYEKEILFVIFLLGLAGIFWTFLANFGLGESGYNFLGKTKRISLSEAPVTQTFTAHENNLHQIHVVLGNADIRSDESLVFRLMDETCRTIIASARFSTEPNQQGIYTLFSFPPIADSENQRYCFSATYSSDKKRDNTPYLSATDHPDAAFSDRTLTEIRKNKTYEHQTLFLRPVYTTGSLLGNLWALVERLSQYKPDFFKDWSIVTLFGIFLAGTIALAYYLVFVPKNTNE